MRLNSIHEHMHTHTHTIATQFFLMRPKKSAFNKYVCRNAMGDATTTASPRLFFKIAEQKNGQISYSYDAVVLSGAAAARTQYVSMFYYSDAGRTEWSGFGYDYYL